MIRCIGKYFSLTDCQRVGRPTPGLVRVECDLAQIRGLAKGIHLSVVLLVFVLGSWC